MASVAVPAVILLVLPTFTLRAHFFQHNRSNDFVCAEYAKNMLVGLERGGIIFTNGDNDTFPLWYIQEVEKYRTDVRVVNLSLLNTPWYIKQLRDNEPKLDIRWSDTDLARLGPIKTKDGSWILVRDIGVQHILKYNSKAKPIYFAVTIPPAIYEPYREFLEMEGLAYRVVPRKGQNMVNLEKLEENVWKNYSYLGLLDEDYQRDESIFHPPFVHRLVQNYAAAFTQLGFLRYRAQDYEEAIKNLEAAEQVSPGLTPVVMWLGWYYLESGDTTRAVQYYRDKIEEDPYDCEVHYRLAGLQERIEDLRGALTTIDAMTEYCPDHRDAVISAVQICLRFNLIDEALRHVDDWIARHPNDESMIRSRQQLLERSTQTPDSVPGNQ
jgi:tetratricopeptide (TPR) repeat protein